MTRSIAILGTVVFVGVVTTGCRMLRPEVEARDDFNYSRPVAGSSALTLDNVNGSVTITGVDGLAEVQISGVKIVNSGSMEDAMEHLKEIEIDVKESGGVITVTTNQPNDGFAYNYAVNYEIKVPRGWKVDVETVNGDVTLAHLGNNVKAATTNGDITGKNITASIEAEVVNGSIHGDMSVPEKGTCMLSTTNGAIETKMEMAASASAHLETVNGGIKLALPKSTSAKLDADVATGEMEVHGLDIAGMDSDRDRISIGEDFNGTLGNGDGTIELDVVNGEIALTGY